MHIPEVPTERSIIRSSMTSCCQETEPPTSSGASGAGAEGNQRRPKLVLQFMSRALR